MEIRDKRIDDGKAFDWGKTSKEYAKFRDIYPEEFYKKIVDRGLCVNGQKVLDLGTGTGVVPRNMYKYGAQWTGTDVSPEQIEQAKILAADGNMKIDFIAAATEQLDFPKESFDVITACQCFWYFNPDIVVPKIKSLLKKGGIFLKLYISYMKEDPVTQDSNALVKKINPSWHGAASALEDLRRHYFENPQLETFITEIPFTREFYKYVAPRKSEEIFAHLQELEKEETALMAKIMGR